MSIPGRSSRAATISYDVGDGPSSGSFTVDALDNGIKTISVTIAAPVYRVTVTPQNTTITVPPSSPQVASFTVQNTGTSPTTYTLTAECGGSITCGSQPGPVTLQGGAQVTVNVDYQSGSAGTTGTVTLTAQAGSVSGYGTSNISSDHVYGVTVGPKNQGVGVAPSSPHTYSFNVHNASDLQQTYTLAVSCTGATWTRIRAECHLLFRSPGKLM